MSTAVIYNTNSPWSQPPAFENSVSFQRAQQSELDRTRSYAGLLFPESVQSHQDHTRSFSRPVFPAPLHPGVSGSHASIHANGTENTMDTPYVIHSSNTEPKSQAALGNSRSARMRRALNVPTRSVAAPTSSSQPRSIYSPVDQRQPEVIAEFGRRDQHVAYPFTTPVSPNTALPPRLQTGNPRSRSRQDLPPRFRSSHAPRVSTPPDNTWNLIPTPQTPSTLNSLAISFQPQLSQSQHLSAFLPNNVTYASGISSDTRPVPPTDPKPLETQTPSTARALAPIGAERAQRLASTANVMPSNYTNAPHNSKLHSLSLASIGPPPGLRKPLPVSNYTAPRQAPNVRLLRLQSSPAAAGQDHRSEIEKLFKWRKLNKVSPRISSPLSPLRNSDSWVASDAKWKREEREQRRQRVMFTCDTSVFRRKLSDRRSRM